jgi:hypothetical protein
MRPGDRVHGVWGQGCGSSEGIILRLHGTHRIQLGMLGPVIEQPQAWILTDDGREICSDVRWKDDGASISPIGWWHRGPCADWEQVAAAWRSAAKRRDKEEAARRETEYQAALATMREWEASARALLRWMSRCGTSCAVVLTADQRIGLGAWHAERREATTSAFGVGDKVKIGSYNFDYIGTLQAISGKTVRVLDHDRVRRFTLRQFYDLNIGWTTAKGAATYAAWQD